jgi:hypothetical protein
VLNSKGNPFGTHQHSCSNGTIDHLTYLAELLERGQVDVFTVEAEDVGALQKIRIGHDGKGIGASWYLESVCEW